MISLTLGLLLSTATWSGDNLASDEALEESWLMLATGQIKFEIIIHGDPA